MTDRAAAKPRATRLEDLAKRAGVSISTASRALNDSPTVNARTKHLIWKLARELDYPFRRYMPAGPVGADATIAVVAPPPQSRQVQTSDPFFLELLSGIAEAARARKCDLLISHVSPATREALSYAMTANRADGVIVIGQSTLHTELNNLAAGDARFVVWGAEMPDQDYCTVGSDNFAGARRATEHLLRLGRERIVFLGDTEAPEAVQRHRGYLAALDVAGAASDPELAAPAHWEMESGEAAVARLVSRGVAFDGVVAASDILALGALRGLERVGRRTPEDVSVIGYDNVAFTRYTRPALSTIDQNPTAGGRMLVSKLLDAGPAGAPSERIPTDLIVRESCGG